MCCMIITNIVVLKLKIAVFSKLYQMKPPNIVAPATNFTVILRIFNPIDVSQCFHYIENYAAQDML